MPLLMVALATWLTACANTSGPALSSEEAVRELTALSHAWDKAIVERNIAGVESNMAPDFKQIRGSGVVVDREQFIRDITDPALKIDPYVVEDFSVHLLGDTALLYGRIHMTGADSGERFASHFRYIDIYVRRDGKWKVVSVQITPMPPAMPKAGLKK